MAKKKKRKGLKWRKGSPILVTPFGARKVAWGKARIAKQFWNPGAPAEPETVRRARELLESRGRLP